MLTRTIMEISFDGGKHYRPVEPLSRPGRINYPGGDTAGAKDADEWLRARSAAETNSSKLWRVHDGRVAVMASHSVTAASLPSWWSHGTSQSAHSAAANMDTHHCRHCGRDPYGVFSEA